MINEHKVYKLVEPPRPDESYKFSPAALTDSSVETLLDSIQHLKICVEYQYRYIGVDPDDDVFESDRSLFRIADVLNDRQFIRCLSVDFAIVIDETDSFVGLLLHNEHRIHFLSPQFSTCQTVKLYERDRLYDHREEETTATFSLCAT